MKTCKNCNLEKPFDEFHLSKKDKDGRVVFCKKCKSEKDRKYYHENRERLIRKSSEYYSDNKEKVSIANKKYREKNKDRKKKSDADYAKKNSEKVALIKAKWAKNNREKCKKWSKNNPEKSSAFIAQWKKDNKDKVRAYGDRRRAKKNETSGEYSSDDIHEIKKLQKYKCAYCPKSIRKKYHVDHIIPLAKGGSNYRKNIQVTCPKCNLKKNSKDPIDYAQQIGKLL